MKNPLASLSLAAACAAIPSAPLPAQTSSTNPGAAAQDDPITLGAFTVTTSQDKGYGATYSTGATRINLPLQNIPTTVVTLNAEFLKDTGALSTTDAVKFVSGMNANGTPYAGQVTVRGFAQGDGVGFKDGIPDNGIIGGSPLNDFATVERVEVIKGPNGVLFGSQVPGGVINSINKQPRPQQRTLVKATAGSFELLRGELDTSGSIVRDQLYYRLVFATQRGETPQGGPNDKLIAYPALTWAPFAGTKITARLDWSRIDLATSRNGWFADAAGAFSTFVPIERTWDEFDESNLITKRTYDVVVEQRLAAAWTARLVGRTSNTDQDKLNYNKTRFDFVSASGAVVGNQNTYRFSQPYADIRSVRDRRRDLLGNNNDSLTFDLVGALKLGPTEHKLLASASTARGKNYNIRRTQTYPTMSIFAPVFRDNPESVTGPITTPTNARGTSKSSGYGVQDTVYLLDERIVLVGGVRRSGAESTGFNVLTNRATSEPRKEATTSKFGAIGKPAKGVALFYNFAETFQPVGGVDDNGVPFKNQSGVTKEGGVKLELLEGRLTGTASLFDVELDNFVRTIADLVTNVPRRVQAGKNLSKGFEADLAWQPTPAVTLTVGYGDLKSKDETGLRIRGVPQGPNYKAFGKYAFTQGRLKGLALGGGYVFTGDSAGDSTDTFNLPEWETVDLFAAYARGRWAFQVNLYNLLDERYVATAVTKTFVYPGSPRNFRASVSFSF
ncbi:MAG: TonB-dependent receptor plug domain-containing protein [Opitutaceae bacterium]|nr:TonB-dependent receptor plug domain-containing protein [Opitutaceae bacterium]